MCCGGKGERLAPNHAGQLVPELAGALAAEQGARTGVLGWGAAAAHQNHGWRVPETGSAGCCVWKGMSDSEKL